MKKGIVLLTGFLLAFSVFLAGCNGDQKESQEKKEQNDKVLSNRHELMKTN